MNRPVNWLQEGREVGVTLDACHAVVVVGSDPVATSEVALGIARVQAQHRRVAVADMFGDAPPLQALVTGTIRMAWWTVSSSACRSIASHTRCRTRASCT